MTESKDQKVSILDRMFENSGSDASAQALDTILKAYTEIVKDNSSTVRKQVEDILSATEYVRNNTMPDRHYDVEEKRIELEHVREMLRLKIDMDKAATESQVTIFRHKQDYMERMYKHFLGMQTGIFGLETKSRKTIAWMLSQQAAKDLFSDLSETIVLPSPSPAPLIGNSEENVLPKRDR